MEDAEFDQVVVIWGFPVINGQFGTPFPIAIVHCNDFESAGIDFDMSGQGFDGIEVVAVLFDLTELSWNEIMDLNRWIRHFLDTAANAVNVSMREVRVD